MPPVDGHSAQARADLAAIIDDLAGEYPVVEGKMFGMPCAKHVSGKVFMGAYGDDLVFKLSGPAIASALDLPGAHLFEPMAGRAMKQWVVVPRSASAHWESLARLAVTTPVG